MAYDLRFATSALTWNEVSSAPSDVALRHNQSAFVICRGIGAKSLQYSRLGWQGLRGELCGLGPQEVSRGPRYLGFVEVYAAARSQIAVREEELLRRKGLM